MSKIMTSGQTMGVLGFLLVLLSLLPSSVALAAQPPTALGTFSDTTTAVTNFRTVNGVLFISTQNTGSFSGPLSGSYVENINIEINLVTGNGPFQLTGTCTCVLDGRVGTFSYRVLGRSQADGSFVSQQSASTAGTGGLSGLSLDGKVVGVTDLVTGLSAGSYIYEYHFSP